ncbi:MAG TPA: hypothetical protein VIL98_06120 [Gaiellaceae bacterium]
MSTTDKRLAKHAKHLVEPPPDFLQEKLKLFNTTPAEFNKLDPVLICALRKGVLIHPKQATPKLIDIVSHTKRVTPETLDELKEIAGIPNRAYAKTQRQLPMLNALDARTVAKLPAKLTVSKLAPELKATFFQLSHDLLQGPTDARLLARAGYKQAVATMLRSAQNLPVFVAPDLIVCDGDSVTFGGYAAVYFNNVLVYGTGQIHLGNHTKLHAYQIKHV